VRHWGSFVEHLENAPYTSRVIAMEVPGAGEFCDQNSPTAIQEYVTYLRQRYSQHLQPGGHTLLLGLSLGGMVAAQWLHNHPSDFSGGVIINSSARPSPFHQRLRPGGAGQLLASALSRNLYNREKRIADCVCNLADTEKVARRWAAIAAEAPISRRNVLRQLFAAATFILPDKPEVPTLILNSEKDRLVAPQCSQDLANQWQSQLICHYRAGHDLTTDDPAWCVDQIGEWIRLVFC
jgi:pimeloyl-ACP methyl ester carboxylesterase